MKKLLTVILLLSMILSIFPTLSYAENCGAFIGINWDDSLESVQTLLGKGEQTEKGDSEVILIYKIEEAEDTFTQYYLHFIDNKLSSIDARIYRLSSPDFPKYYYDVMVLDYGEPTIVTAESINAETIEEDPSGTVCCWKIGEETVILWESPMEGGSVLLMFRKIQDNILKNDGK